MKKQFFNAAVLLGIICLFTACEKVIELDLSSSKPEIVIQGTVDDGLGVYTVSISKTVRYNASNEFPPVTNAVVTISDGAGTSDRLNEVSDGVYKTSVLKGVPGRTYTLTVVVEGKEYIATSTMPAAVEVKSIVVEKSLFGGDKQIAIEFVDPPKIENYYRIVQYINGIQQDGFDVLSDDFSDGELIKCTLQPQNMEDKLLLGDKVIVRLQCIDKGVYEYFRTAGGGHGPSSSPSNPISNISNGALGYFSAGSERQVNVIVR